jgi:hypothetical protein
LDTTPQLDVAFCDIKFTQLEEPIWHFEKAEMDLLRESLRLSHKERFLRATRLYKIQQTMKKAVITHKPFISK